MSQPMPGLAPGMIGNIAELPAASRLNREDNMTDNWKKNALAATKGTQLGAIIACALGVETPHPCFVGKASLTSDGFIICNFIDKNGEGHMGAFVGSSSDLVRNARGLAEHLKLDDVDRKALFAALHGWAAVRDLEVA